MTDHRVTAATRTAPPRFRAYTARDLDRLTSRAGLEAAERLAVRAVAAILPFRTNDYVIESLIDWSAAPDDPIYRLVFPQADMLPAADTQQVADLISRGAPEREVQVAAHAVRMRLNPHPAGQATLNVPRAGGQPLPGVQHKYPQTILVFPRQGQTCHAYCTCCFRWAQFTGEPDLKIATSDIPAITAYLRAHPEVTSVLITGGDPMITTAELLRRYVEPLLAPELGHIESIRIGTKALAYWPHRFLTDPGADDTLRLFEQVTASGKNLAVMAHFSHPRELEPPPVAAAARRISATGALIRTQGLDRARLPRTRTLTDSAPPHTTFTAEPARCEGQNWNGQYWSNDWRGWHGMGWHHNWHGRNQNGQHPWSRNRSGWRTRRRILLVDRRWPALRRHPCRAVRHLRPPRLRGLP